MIENVLVGLSIAAVGSVLLSNVIRIIWSPETGIAMRTMFFAASWVAAIAWAIASGERRARIWLGALVISGGLIVLCQAVAGEIDSSVTRHVIGPGGAGLGAALCLRRLMQPDRIAWTTTAAVMFGCGAAVWLALEHRMELWKLLPNEWEISKDLNYRWGHREGFERARFIFDTAMEAGVAQWLLGAVALATALKSTLARSVRLSFAAIAILLFASVSLTVSRAGIALGGVSIVLVAIMAFRGRIRLLTASVVVLLFSAGLIAFFLGTDSAHPVARFSARALDPSEEGNRERIQQLENFGFELAETPWHGKGAPTFITYLRTPQTDEQRALFKKAPLMPVYESTPVSLIIPFGIGGWLLVGIFGWLLISNVVRISQILHRSSVTVESQFNSLIVLTAFPFFLYSLVAPIFSGLSFSLIAYTLAGGLVIWDTPLRSDSGKH